MNKIILILLCLAILSGCEKVTPPESISSTSNNNIQVELIFENDGCKIYRFEDYGYERYYANCAPGIIGGHTHMVGKISIYHDDTTPTRE